MVPDANVSASKSFPTPKRSVTAPFVSIVPNVEKPFASAARSRGGGALPEVPRRERQRVEVVADAEAVGDAPFVSIVPNVEKPFGVVTEVVEQVRPVAKVPDANVSASKSSPTPKRSVTVPFVSIVPNVENPRPDVGQLQDLLLGVGLMRHCHRPHQDDFVDRARVG